MGCSGSKCSSCAHENSSNNEVQDNNDQPQQAANISTSADDVNNRSSAKSGGAAAAAVAALLAQDKNTFLIVSTSTSITAGTASTSGGGTSIFHSLEDTNNNKMVALDYQQQQQRPATPTTPKGSANAAATFVDQTAKIEELESSVKWLQTRLHDADKQITSYKKDLAAVTINFELAQDEICRQRKLLEERDEEIRNLKRIKDVYQSVMRGAGILPSAALTTKYPGGSASGSGQPTIIPRASAGGVTRSANLSPEPPTLVTATAGSSATSSNTNLLNLSEHQHRLRDSKKKTTAATSAATTDSPNKGQQMLKRVVDDTQPTTHDGTPKLRESFSLKFRQSAVEKATTEGATGLQQHQQSNSYSTSKDFSTKETLKKALLKNDLLQEILQTTGPSVTSEIIENMYKRFYARNDIVIAEGEPADALFVLTAGKLEIRKAGKVFGSLEPAKAFGEIGIIYKCTRTASVIAIANDTCVWTLDRQTYQKIIMNAGQSREEELLQIIRHVPLLQTLDEKQLRKVAMALDTEYYTKGSYIIRQGEAGDVFFIINSGIVEVMQIRPGLEEPKVIRELERGAFFGEKALLREDKRSASVVAKTDCECLTLEREKFLQLIPAELFGGDASTHPKSRKGTQTAILAPLDGQPPSTTPHTPLAATLSAIPIYGDDEHSESAEETDMLQKLQTIKNVNQIEFVSVIGRGGFGKVYLAEPLLSSPARTTTSTRTEQHQLGTVNGGDDEIQRKIYALKLLSKRFVMSERQFEHVKWEKDILFDMRSPFIVRLYTSFMDAKYVYLLLEICQGGDLFQRLRQCGRFELEEAQFHSACVVSALQYIHNRGIVYRDLKPENCVMDAHGYTKIVDFGFAKEVLAGKTYTFCGTPQYLAPELIIGSGHDIAVDYWSFGILMFELTSGCSPFYFAGDIYQLYLDILDGIERVEFPRDIGSSARDLIRRLCRKKPTDRIGYGYNGVKQIKKHKYFQAFDWAGLKSKSLKAPFIPKLASAHDTSHFRHVKTRAEEMSEGEVPPPDDFSAEWETF